MKYTDKNGNVVAFNKYEAAVLRGKGHSLTPVVRVKEVVEVKTKVRKKKSKVKNDVAQ